MTNITKGGRFGIASLLTVAMSAGFVSCGDNSFKVEGTVDDGADKTIVLEKADFYGRWIPIDSTHVSSSGTFSIKADAPSSPEIYRLSLGDRYIYLPVDSTESLTVKTKANNFGGEFTVTGTAQAEKMAAFEKELMKLDFTDSLKRESFKRDVYAKYLQDAQGSIVSYYVLTKIVGDKPLYSPDDKNDLKYYAAVATSFEQYRPNDPHVKMLHDVSVKAMQKKNSEAGLKHVVEAQEISIIDLDLPDETGTNRKLSDLVKNGHRTVLIVSMMNRSESPAFNIALSELYKKLGGSVNFYQVSLDSDQYAWRDAAKNLPWTTVYDAGGNSSDILRKYNISVVPAFFIYSAEGNLVDRAEDLQDLRKKL